MRWTTTYTAEKVPAHKIVGQISNTQITSVSSSSVFFDDGKNAQDAFPDYDSTADFANRFQCILSNPNATTGAQRTYNRLSRRRFGFSDSTRANYPILFGQDAGTWSTVYGTGIRTEEYTMGHDSVGSDIHKTTGYYPSVVNFDLGVDIDYTMNATAGLVYNNTAVEVFNKYKTKFDKIVNRGGEFYLHFSWKMQWPLAFNEGITVSGTLDTHINLKEYHAGWVYRRYTNLAIGNDSSLTSWFSGNFSSFTNDITTVGTPRYTRFRGILEYAGDFLERVSQEYQDIGIGLPLFPNSNQTITNTSSAVADAWQDVMPWWGMLNFDSYKRLFQYCVNYFRSRSINSLIIDYNVRYVAPISGRTVLVDSTNTEEVVALRYACQPETSKSLQDRYPGNDFVDTLSMTMRTDIPVNANSAAIFVGPIQRLVMDAEMYNKVPAIFDFGFNLSTLNTSAPANTAGYWESMMTSIMRNQYARQIGYMIVARNTISFGHIPTPRFNRTRDLEQFTFPEFRRYFSTENPLFGKHVYLQPSKVYTLMTQNGYYNTITTNASSFQQGNVTTDRDTWIFAANGWKGPGNVSVEFLEGTGTANITRFSIEDPKAPDLRVGDIPINELIANNPTRTTNLTNFFTDTRTSGANVYQYPILYGYQYVPRIGFNEGTTTKSFKTRVTMNYFAPE
jgi:hypothetical protein